LRYIGNDKKSWVIKRIPASLSLSLSIEPKALCIQAKALPLSYIPSGSMALVNPCGLFIPSECFARGTYWLRLGSTAYARERSSFSAIGKTLGS
jgi:hypothetical protein